MVLSIILLLSQQEALPIPLLWVGIFLIFKVLTKNLCFQLIRKNLTLRMKSLWFQLVRKNLTLGMKLVRGNLRLTRLRKVLLEDGRCDEDLCPVSRKPRKTKNSSVSIKNICAINSFLLSVASFCVRCWKYISFSDGIANWNHVISQSVISCHLFVKSP